MKKIYIPKVGEDEVPIESSVGMSNDVINNGKININTCTKKLMSLPGIGGLAGRIISIETNPFKTAEEIKNVSGIGDKNLKVLGI